MASIVVVGAGLAGLTCAWRLQRAGHDVVALECEETPGGRIATDRRGEFVVERGAACFELASPNVEGLVEALGLGPRLLPLAADGRSIWDGSRFARSTVGGRRQGLRLPLALASQHRHLDPEHPERAVALDGQDAARWLRGLAGEARLADRVEPLLTERFDLAPERLSAGFAALALQRLRRPPTRASLVGGMQLLTDALASQLTVRTGCEAIRVETAADGARIHYRTLRREGSLLADAAVLALPGTRIPFVCPRLAPNERAFFERVRYGRGLVVSLLLDKEPAGLPGWRLALARRSGLDLRAVEVGHRVPGAAPRGTALLRTFLSEEASSRLWWASEEAIVECVTDALARTPVGRLAPLECVVQRWDPLLPHFEPGGLRRLAAFLGRTERSPRLAFAGDYLVGPDVPGAVTSGMRAAAEIAATLARSAPQPAA